VSAPLSAFKNAASTLAETPGLAAQSIPPLAVRRARPEDEDEDEDEDEQS
jgi:hypothetical protein